ncbi:tetratricopeptide repeat protein [Mesobacterium sp. TK19101]|uniref:Tetratricopeptide repeat protein n=1 Tax=Mesobacterium hydrothermale TaxID=3111907 RepID=A0ABU6HBQ6_9RHOB|nr:tetratricopeptide repeat protein [Mesobacterium sp. TK19101]MEC3859897.1 tetratricopeptide repeat protein [Mesobacterium sp. TK19101]
MRRIFALAATGLCLALTQPAVAQGVSGAYLAGRQASFLGDFEAAARYYSEAIMHDPGKPELLERAALSYLSLGNIDRATLFGDKLEADGHRSQIAQMAKIGALGAKGNYAEILKRLDEDRGVGPLADGLVKAWATLGEGDMTAALVAFDEVGQERVLTGFAMYHKAVALASVGDFETAIDILSDPAVGPMRNTRRAVVARAQILSQLQRYDDAVTLINQQFRGDLDPELTQMVDTLKAGDALPFTTVRSARDGMAETFYTLAGALSDEADDDFTLLYARLAEYLRPDHVPAILLTAELLEKIGQSDLAVETYRKVPSDNPSFHAAEIGRAAALRDSGRDEAAIEVLESLAKTHGDMAIVQSTLGDTMRKMERFAEAVTAYTKALDLYEGDPQRQWFLYYARGICNERVGDWPNAEADLRKALELNPNQPNILNYLGYSLVQQHIKLDEALDMIERAVDASPNSGYIVDSLGWVLYTLGRYDEAVGHMERAAELMPVDPVVNDHLGDVYWAVGRHMEARFMWRRALSFLDHGTASEEVDPDRIRRKLEVGLDEVLIEEGADPLKVADGDN